jgi:dTDP-4-amino-4,6-dideoxygalactose transaminase
MSVLPVMRPRLPVATSVLDYLRAMDERRIYANFGPLVEEVEARYAERFSVPPDLVVACANATLGLQGAVAVSPATRFHCPAWTFAATPLAVVGAGADLDFHDIRRSDWHIDPPDANTGDGLIPVLPFGAELDRNRWLGWSEVVVDAAASGGMSGRDLSWLPAGWAVVFSLHATKVLGAGEGAIVVFGDADRALRFREYTALGFRGRRESEFIGTNAKMSEMAAAYALAALDDWEVEHAEWSAAHTLVREAEALLGIGSVCSGYPGVSPYWVVAFDTPERATECEGALEAADIGSRRWWPVACTRMVAFADAWAHLPMPESDFACATTLGLPFFRDLAASDVERVVDALAPVLAAQR